MNDIIWEYSIERDRIQWSSAASTVLGYPETLSGTTREWWVERIHPADRFKALAQLRRVVASGQSQWVQEFPGLRCRRLLISHGYVLRYTTGNAKRIIGSLQDVTNRKEYEAKLQWAAHHDALTALPNRALFNEHLESVFRNGGPTDGCTLLIILDVGRFKAVNDDLGHDAGDALLREVGQRLRSAVLSSAT